MFIIIAISQNLLKLTNSNCVQLKIWYGNVEQDGCANWVLLIYQTGNNITGQWNMDQKYYVLVQIS